MNRSFVLAPEAGAATLKPRPWGGSRLREVRGEGIADLPAGPIGESWEFSTLPGSQSRSSGRPLGEHLDGPLPMLVKLIDTERALSVQVHPEDDPATGTSGKEEAWVVLDAKPSAEVRCGLRAGVDLAQLRERSEAASRDPSRHGRALVESMECIDLRRGTVILVPARTLHAIGGGVLLAEIQQAADCTFRLFDYGSERPIHPEQTLATVDPQRRPLVWQPGDAPTTLEGEHVQMRVADAGLESVPWPESIRVALNLGPATTLRQEGHDHLCPRDALRLCAGNVALAPALHAGAMVFGRLT